MQIEPVSATPPRRVRLPVMRQDFRDTVFVHWEVAPEETRRFLPDGVEPDLFRGRTFVGLVALRVRTAALDLVPLPYLGHFPEVNVRLYSVDRAGRRGIVLRSLDAGRLVPAVVGRAVSRLPYMWWAGEGGRSGDMVTYGGRRRWPERGPGIRLAARVGKPLARPTALDHFLTARWAVHWSCCGQTLWAAAEHEPWPLHRAELVDLDDDLISAAGLPAPDGPPVSVLYSPGVSTRIGPPQLI